MWHGFIHISLHWRHNDHDGVSNHQPHGCLLNHLFRRRSKKTSKLHVTGLCVGNSPGPVNSPHKGPVTRKMFPFDDVIMLAKLLPQLCEHGQSETIFFLPVRCSFAVAVAAGGLETARIFQIDFSYLYNCCGQVYIVRNYHITLEGPEDRHLRNSSCGGHVTSLTLQYLWPRPPGVWLGGPGCKPGHSRRS